jgi:AcrR family transcriptional regulator
VSKRDGKRTREAILTAAEVLFARKGFDATSMQQIGVAAGVARSTPAYFFGSKEALYQAVLERAVARAQRAIAQTYERGEDHTSPEAAVEVYVDALVDFLGRDPTFVHLIQREAIGTGGLAAEFFGDLVDDALAAFAPAAELAGVSAQRLVLDLIALCWYPFEHEHTLGPALGMKPRDPVFLAEQKRHLADMVRALTGQHPTGPGQRQRSRRRRTR